MADWEPPRGKPVDEDWEPPRGRIPVSAHTRSRRRNEAVANIPLVFPGPGGPITLDRGTVAQALPTLAGTVAGALTKPFAAGVPAAAGAGSLGELGGELLMGQTPDWEQIARTGATQGAYEATGRGIGKGLKLISGPIMQLALRAGPDVAATAIREGISATGAGIRKVLARLGQRGAETDRIVGQANRLGKPYDMVALLKGAYQDVRPKVEFSMSGDELRDLNASLFKFVGQNPKASVRATSLHGLKKAADQAASSIYRLRGSATPPTAAQEASAGFYKAFADRARQTMNATIPDYESSNAATESLIKLKEALVPTAKKELSKGAVVASALLKPSVRAAVGAQVGYDIPGDRGRNAMLGAGLGLVGASPTALSGAALGLQSPLLQLLLRQAPRQIGGILQSPAY